MKLSRAASIWARPRAVDGRHDAAGRYAFMYVADGMSNSSSTISPFDAMRYRSMMTPERLQTCFWNALLRAVVILAGGVSLPMLGTDVPTADHLTVFLAVSLNVI